MYVCLCVGGGEWGGGVREIECWGWGVGRGREGGGVRQTVRHSAYQC